MQTLHYLSMKADLLKGLFRAFAQHDNDQFISYARQVIEEEKALKHNGVAEALETALLAVEGQTAKQSLLLKSRDIPVDNQSGFPLLKVMRPRHYRDDLILAEPENKQIDRIIQENESKRILAKFGMEPKKRILFCGPPGTGKTLAAHVVAATLDRPLVHVQFDSVVSSLLGETAVNLKRIFEYIGGGKAVVLFDEFDIIGKRRDDPTEHGEIKRVVNNLMQLLDAYQGESILIAATNHQTLLDQAVWRRFDDVVLFPMPDARARERLFTKAVSIFGDKAALDIDILVKLSDGFSASDIAQVCSEAIRTALLSSENRLAMKTLQEAIAAQRRRIAALQG